MGDVVRLAPGSGVLQSYAGKGFLLFLVLSPISVERHQQSGLRGGAGNLEESRKYKVRELLHTLSG